MDPQERINSVCEYRNIPQVKINQPCLVDGREGWIVNGNSSANFNVQFEIDGYAFNCHPDYKMVIFSQDKDSVIFESRD